MAAQSIVIKCASLALANSALVFAANSNAAELVTLDDANNGQSGVMFDAVIGANSLSIESIRVRTTAQTGSFEFYTRTGGIAGNENNAAAWTLRDIFSNVTTSNGYTVFNISDFVAAANSTVGFYFTFTTPFVDAVRYSNGTGVGNVRAANGDLTILQGFGKSYPFAQSFQPRSFVGSISYSVAGIPAVPEPSTWLMLVLGFGFIGAALRFEKARQRTRVLVSYT